MSDVKGGSGLHGRDKQQSTLRDVRSGAYDKGGPSQAPDPNEAQRTEHQRAQWGADVRQGVPESETGARGGERFAARLVSKENGTTG